jgi:3'-phosphoadenosine 5'-phosphosulfate sulfotransferase (PAPS reductase)/FAD synthetase
MSNPYLITGPALISFSGGRTSAFMLRQILDAHGGTLPDDVVVAFANTGKEREETLRFVHECGSRWGVKVHWLERADQGGFVEVGFNSASRNGEPFAALIAKRKFTPNAVTRFCTSELKVRVMRDFCLSLGWENWSNVVGLRYDEGLRVLKMIARNQAGKERWTSLMPISKAKHVKRDVMAFWADQDFDLGLKDYEGNCDLCFLKSRGKLEAIIRENPGIADWWSRMETVGKGRFVTEYSYAKLTDHVARSPVMPGILDDEEYDAECGLTCVGDAA